MPAAPPIDRLAVVHRHNVILREVDRDNPLTVGNGEFAFTADATGLQTFADDFADTVPLCTQSQWGWHTNPLPPGVRREDFRLTDFDSDGRPVPYRMRRDEPAQQAAYWWLRENPHRMNLGRIGLRLRRPDGSDAAIGDVGQVYQELDLWAGRLTSRFVFAGERVTVETCCPGDTDGVATRVTSPLLKRGGLSIVVRFPYPGPSAAGTAAKPWDAPERHTSTLTPAGPNAVRIARRLDGDAYGVALRWSSATLAETAAHTFELSSAAGADSIELTCTFAASPDDEADPPSFDASRDASAAMWADFWTSGGAIDFDGSTDPRARELERRVVLSQYLMRVNCAGSLPPQETGLTINSWYGKFHLEMHWWHGVQFACWGRLPLLERSLGFYGRILPRARALAEEQGYRGVRWPKMVGPDGEDGPSPIGPLLLWQQPHPIYYAELCYRERPTRETLDHWREIVEQTAVFMADRTHRSADGVYSLNPPIKGVQENNPPLETRNRRSSYCIGDSASPRRSGGANGSASRGTPSGTRCSPASRRCPRPTGATCSTKA